MKIDNLIKGFKGNTKEALIIVDSKTIEKYKKEIGHMENPLQGVFKKPIKSNIFSYYKDGVNLHFVDKNDIVEDLLKPTNPNHHYPSAN